MTTTLPKRICPGCRRNKAEKGRYCPACEAKGKGKRKDTRPRKKTAERGYNAAWRRVRAQVLAEANHLCQCEKCRAMGRVKVAKVVHHIKSVKERPDLRLVRSNLMAINWFCHEREHGRRGRGR